MYNPNCYLHIFKHLLPQETRSLGGSQNTERYVFYCLLETTEYQKKRINNSVYHLNVSVYHLRIQEIMTGD